MTGGSPRSTGVFYDVSYDRSLSPPAKTTPAGVLGGSDLCPRVKGTVVEYDELVDFGLTSLDGEGGINPDYLPRDPHNRCRPVYPHTFLRVNTIFDVVKAAGGYTAWVDKHPAYEIGPTGAGVDDFYGPEINSVMVALNQVTGCSPVPDPTATDAWTSSFQNIQCYDTLKVKAILNEIDGRTHDGTVAAPVPTVFGMNFQAVSVGQKLVEHSIRGGYTDALGTPSSGLLGEIEFVDAAVGQMVHELKKHGLFDST